MSAVKKLVKGAVKFVKKNWKAIAIAAAVVFTAGIASVGVAGFMTAASGGGITGALSAVGSTMAAGASAIGASLGITTAAAPAAGAAAGGSSLVGAGLTVPSGLASSLAAAAPAATGSLAAGAGVLAPAAGGLTLAGSGGALSAAASGASAIAPTAARAIAPVARQTALQSFMSSPLAGPVLMGGINMLTAGGGQESDRPIAVYGVNADRGKPKKKFGQNLTPEDMEVQGQFFDPQTFATPNAGGG